MYGVLQPLVVYEPLKQRSLDTGCMFLGSLGCLVTLYEVILIN